MDISGAVVLGGVSRLYLCRSQPESRSSLILCRHNLAAFVTDEGTADERLYFAGGSQVYNVAYFDGTSMYTMSSLIKTPDRPLSFAELMSRAT